MIGDKLHLRFNFPRSRLRLWRVFWALEAPLAPIEWLGLPCTGYAGEAL